MDSQQCLWFSRLSFGVSVFALIGGVTGACSRKDSSLSAEQMRASQVLAPAGQPETKTPRASDEARNETASKPVDETKAILNVDDLPKAESAKAPKTAKAEAEAPRKTVDGAAELQLKRLVVTGRVEDREPVATDAFELGSGPVLAFVELANPSDEEQHVVVTFEPQGGGEKVGFVELSIPAKSPRWRTWGSTRRIDKTGEWMATVSIKDGPALASTAFTVTEAETPSEPSEALASK